MVEGGSTITQQLVRNLYISRERTVQRKLKEACLATKLDGAWSKQRIPTTYLNQVFYGNQAYGIEAAAQTYFSKPRGELNARRVRAARGLTQAPSTYDPFTPGLGARPPRGRAAGHARDRRGHAQAVPEGCGRRRSPCDRDGLYSRIREPYFFGYVRDRLIEAYGAEQVRSGGLSVYTTIVPRYQRLAERAIPRHDVPAH